MGEQEEQSSIETKDIPGLPDDERIALSLEGDLGDAALKEATQLSSGRSEDELRAEAAENEHNRNENFRDLFNDLVSIGMMCAFVAVLALAAVWVWHLLTPCQLHWLSRDQIDHIQGMITGGVLAALVGDHFKRRLG